jgi:RHS repeat-associated protein
MVASSIPCKLSLCADRAHACAGDSYVSSGIDVACPTTQNVLAIASPHELHGDSWPSSSTGTSSICCNQQYSITAVTTSTGSIAERYAYSAYGQPTVLDASASVLSSSAINNRYTYTGREWDATLGLHHFRARWMSPSAGRFLTRDPIGFEGSPWGLYEFAGGRALMSVDPTGWEGKIIGEPISFPRRPPYIIPRGKCILAFECTWTGGLGIPGTNAYHCGLMVKYWNESGPVTKHLHAWGISPRQGETGGCKIDSVSPSRVGGFTINSPVLVPQSACECIVNNIEAYNNFMDRHDKYRAIPSNSCDGSPSCNSNFASACQLSKCNISHRPSVWAPGFDHRMNSCKKRKKVKSCVGWRSDSKTDEYRCECDEWEPIDSDVCGSN